MSGDRNTFGEGGNLRAGVSYASKELVRLGWTMEIRKTLADSRGAYAYTADMTAPTGVEYRMIITARKRKPFPGWSVTTDIGGIAQTHDAWLFAYFDAPLQQVLVFDPNQYVATSPARGGTFEFNLSQGLDLAQWLVRPSARVFHKRLH